MTGGVLGGGVIFVVAALLWAAVLVPTWMRRREFRAAERNALRLQRTLRVLAETSEVPEEVRLEATAKQALAQEKLLRTAQKRQEAEREAELAEARAEQVRAEIKAQQMQRKRAAAQRAARLKRPAVRRVRALAALFGLGGLVGVLVGAGLALAGSGPAVLLWSAAVAATGIGALVLIAPGRARLRTIDAEHVREPAYTAQPDVGDASVASGEAEADYSAQVAAHAEAQRAAAQRIERAQAMARARASAPGSGGQRENLTDSILLREAREQVSRARAAEDRGDSMGATEGVSGVDAARERAERERLERERVAERAAERERAQRERAIASEQRAQSERLRQMGVVGDTSEGMPDLDAVLRRRRRAG